VNRKPENIAMFTAAAMGIASAIHDFGLGMKAWQGVHFALLPLCGRDDLPGLCLCAGPTSDRCTGHGREPQRHPRRAGGRRQRRTGAQSKQIRELEVAVALEQERERIMREMHDSVGANLISALAVAEHGDASRRTVATLKRSLTDLRIAVDLLEQVDGDITLLLASFRYRMEPELRAAGWRFDWRVENVPALEWLDLANALHVLRILQRR
jgi:signal transduction histidine kinase